MQKTKTLCVIAHKYVLKIVQKIQQKDNEAQGLTHTYGDLYLAYEAIKKSVVNVSYKEAEETKINLFKKLWKE